MQATSLIRNCSTFIQQFNMLATMFTLDIHLLACVFGIWTQNTEISYCILFKGLDSKGIVANKYVSFNWWVYNSISYVKHVLTLPKSVRAVL